MSVTGAILAGVGAAGSIGGAAIASHGANQAADTQAASANHAADVQAASADKALQFEKDVYGTQQQELAPGYEIGTSAYANLANLLGLMGPSVSSTPVYAPGAPTTTSTGVPNAIPFEGNPNIPQYIPGPHGSDMPNPAYAAQQRSTISANLPSGSGNPAGPPSSTTPNLGNLVNLSLGATGSLMQPWDQTFQAPTNVTEQNDPGYKFRMQQGLDAVQRSAAARGGALTEGAAKDVNDYAQQDASNEYGNTYNRALQTYGTNYDTFSNERSTRYNQLASLAGLAQTNTNQLVGAGSTAAGQVGNTLLTSAGQIGQNINNAGAARASGYAASANAYGGAVGGIGNNLSNLYLLSQLQGGGTNLGTLGASDIGNMPFTVS